jgi:hypothetical protein
MDDFNGKTIILKLTDDTKVIAILAPLDKGKISKIKSSQSQGATRKNKASFSLNQA